MTEGETRLFLRKYRIVLVKCGVMVAVVLFVFFRLI